ncbi:vacuolar protein sorting associated protein 51 [Trichuris trichiura]|uniref:Vacuolar protein sorting-associated protein 51 homolog n=1 Tax=Trichuris trichiura TaxID=36087 RepID=A0A077Z6X7_TRITR|nr:vacuolar protein sorting associated protein 51 [Trichuris trichiura]
MTDEKAYNVGTSGSDCLNIDNSNFNSEMYIRKIVHEESLQELMNREHNLTQQLKSLDLDMQTLVYENYNKFITATDTVRSMRQDFIRMEGEMENLMESMDTITKSSNSLSSELVQKRKEMERLSRVKAIVKHLQFLFSFPSTLQSYIQATDYAAAVHAYQQYKDAFEQFKDVQALQSLYVETNTIIANLKDHLLEEFHSKILSGQELLSHVELLIKLGEQPSALAGDYLKSSFACLRQELDDTQASDQEMTSSDVLHFVDTVCSTFLGNVSLVITSWRSIFNDVDQSELIDQISQLLIEYIAHCKEKFSTKVFTTESGFLMARALDRFYRRLLAIEQVLPLKAQVQSAAMELIKSTAWQQIHLVNQSANDSFEVAFQLGQQSLNDCKRYIVQHKPLALRVGGNEKSGNVEQPLATALLTMENALLANVKTSFAALFHFVATDLSFLTQSGFTEEFASVLKRDFLLPFFRHIVHSCNQCCNESQERSSTSTMLILILCKMCSDCASSIFDKVIDLYEHQCALRHEPIEDKDYSQLKVDLETLSRTLLDRFVMLEGFQLSQMLVKSAETRDWMASVEPRTVRSVIKRIVEDLTGIDNCVGQLLEEGHRKELNSDSSRRTSVANYSRSLRSWNVGTSAYGTPAFTNTLGKLWNERVDYDIRADFTKISVTTGIVKICLKTFLEVVRLRTYSKFGLQQLQIDCHYLQLFLWRFVVDESLILNLLDEVVSSAVQRCVEPQLMEPTLVSLVCERE